MTQVAVNYAGALYELSLEEGLSADLLQQLQVLQTSFAEEPAFVRLLAAPNISKEERCNVLEESFRDRVHPYVLNFLKILTEKGYIRHFSDCCKAFENRYNTDNGILPVLAETAVALTPDQLGRLQEKLQTITGKKVVLENQVVPACLGGVRLRYDGTQVDGTVQGRLKAMGNLLQNTVL